jgi:hypothetical protein
MSREEHLTELVRQGQALRQEDIDLGAKQERERIIKLLEDYAEKEYEFTLTAERELIALIKGEN